MEKKHFFLRLNPPRPTFPGDITPEEQIIMKNHAEYWRSLMDKGTVLIFGPVMDPKGTFGMGILEVENEQEIKDFITKDPVIINRLGKYEYYPMRAVSPEHS
jgi:uncharacterized protein YciI